MKKLLINIGIIIIIWILVFVMVSFYLKWATKHGESVTVPNLSGISLKDAKELLTQKSLVININDSTYDPKFAPLSIVDQNPKPYSKVKQGRNIYVVINSTTVPMVEVPNIKDLSYRSGIAQLANLQLHEGNVSYVADEAKDAIIEYSYKGKLLREGDKVPVNSFIDIVLGDGESKSSVRVPSVEGMSFHDAVFLIKGNKLVIGQINADRLPIRDSFNTYVIKQSPMGGNQNSIPIGSAINLWVE